jgi:glucose/mannose-6-phosphate isomerase
LELIIEEGAVDGINYPKVDPNIFYSHFKPFNSTIQLIFMLPLLDNLKKINEIDKEDMLGTIGSFPVNARKAIEDSEELDLSPIKKKKFDSILIGGMGGSAIGGLLLRDWLRGTCKVPIIISRGYHLPAWADENTLIYAVSYSGDTEETYTQYHEAVDRGCQVVCFCSGGKMSWSASQHKIPKLLFPKNFQPRAAIASQFYSIAAITKRMGFIHEDKWAEVEESIRVVESLVKKLEKEVLTNNNPAKLLADSVYGLIPFIYGTRLFKTVAYRYKTQFNENSKILAATNFFPEAFHNSVMACEGNKELLKKNCGIFIHDPLEDSSLKFKIKKFKELLKENIGRIVEVETFGEGELARMMSAITIGDYASAYLGILYGKDPSSIESIKKFKED